MDGYYVTFRTTDAMDATAYANVSALNTDEPMELADVIVHCETLECDADLYDEQGSRRGWQPRRPPAGCR